MSVQSLPVEVEYPESDGQPMGETDLHRDWMIRILDLLRRRYRGERVYVSGDLLVYYREGDPKKYVVPDAFVVLDCDPHRRRVFKIWEEQRVPSVVFETTSRRTKSKDTDVKPEIYERLGIAEYFLYDPTGDYLDPPLAGYRLTEEGYAAIRPNGAGQLACQELGLLLETVEGELILRDGQSGERLLTAEEAEHAALEVGQAALEAERAAREVEQAALEAERAAREAEQAALEAERAAREAEQVARAAAEAEVRRLRERLRQHGLEE